jgi:hypothetical protein
MGFGQSGALPEGVKRKRNWWPELWGLLGFVTMVASFFAPRERALSLLAIALLAVLRADVLGIRREIDRWRVPMTVIDYLDRGPLHFTAPPARCSLWDMVSNLSVSGVIGLVDELHVQISTSSHNKDLEAKTPSGELKGEEHQEALQQSIESNEYILDGTANLLKLTPNSHIEYAAERLRAWADDKDKRWADLFTRSCSLRDAIRIEFKDRVFYAYPKERGQKLKSWKANWEKIHTAFPDVNVDSYCATDCYGLQHNTASVFHSMRVAEIGLRALAGERRVKLPKNKPVEWGTWQEIIKALDDEIRTIGQTWKAGSRKDAALDFYSGARADLNGFKDEYRNLVMHVRKQYDEFQALRALTRVHDFMSRLAEKIDHKHHRIKWGRSS